MPSRKNWKPRTITDAQWFVFLAFMALITRLPMLGVAKAETTDGIYCLTYFAPNFVPNDRFVIFPGYPFLLHLLQLAGVEGVWGGRALAALASALLLIPLWRFARRWMSSEMTGIVCTMALFAPLLWQWSLKVMPDTLFLLFFWTALESLASAQEKNSPRAWLLACLAGAASACTRPEGYLLVPWLWSVSESLGIEGRWKRRALLALAWVGPLAFLLPKFGLILDAYREGAGINPILPHRFFLMVNFFKHLYTYLTQPVYVFTPLILGASFLGLGKMARREGPEGQAFRRILLQVYFLLFVSRLFPVSYQDRYLLPFLPLVLVSAGYELELFFGKWENAAKPVWSMLIKNGALTAMLAWCVIYSTGVQISQNDSFGDVKRSAEFLKTLPPDAVIYSDEIPKTQYWSGRPLKLVTLPFTPPQGSYVLLHSFYTNRLGFVDQHMREGLGGRVIHQESSMVVPLLTDVMEDSSLQNRCEATAFRFEPQFFTTFTYHMEK
jgi:4-amino-4-deoxy-L-arabinose transferase-like glycosyltransferase